MRPVALNLVAASLLLAATCTPLSAQSVVAADSCLCGNQASAHRDSLESFQLGVSARSVGASIIGDKFTAKQEWILLGSFGGDHWVPVDGTKRTMCGQVLKDERFYHGAVVKHEEDWNHHVVPNPASEFLYTLAPDKLVPCHGDPDATSRCLEAEVTPDEDMRPMLSILPTREGDSICVYGPWVWDGGHDSKVEIHPSELLWWRDRDRSKTTYSLLVVQDASQRYSKRDGFRPTPPPTWPVWADSVLVAEFRVAVSFDTLVRTVMAVTTPFKYGLARVNALPKSAAPLSDVTWHGRVIATLARFQDPFTDIRIDSLCLQPGTSKVAGYLTVLARVARPGDISRGAFALTEIMVTTDPIDSGKLAGLLIAGRNPAFGAPLPPVLNATISAPSLRAIRTSAGETRLVASVMVNASAPGLDLTPTSTARVGTTGTEATNVRQYRLSQARSKVVGRVDSVEVSSGGVIRLNTKTVPLSVAFPRLSVATRVADLSPQLGDADANHLGAFFRAAGVPASNGIKQSAALRRVNTWTFSTQSAFAPLAGTEHRIEDRQSLADTLNAVLLGGDSAQTVRLFASTRPVAFRVAVVDSLGAQHFLSDGTRQASIGNVQYSMKVSGPLRWSSGLALPAGDTSFRTLTLRYDSHDVFGGSDQGQLHLPSHVLAGTPGELREAVISLAITAVDARPEDFKRDLTDAERTGSPEFLSARFSRARALRNLATMYSERGVVRPEEFGRVYQLARLWLATPSAPPR